VGLGLGLPFAEDIVSGEAHSAPNITARNTTNKQSFTVTLVRREELITGESPIANRRGLFWKGWGPPVHAKGARLWEAAETVLGGQPNTP
jgi:hypothetical protein